MGCLPISVILLVAFVSVCHGQPGSPCDETLSLECPTDRSGQRVPCIARPLDPAVVAIRPDEPSFVCDCTTIEMISFDCSEIPLGRQGFTTCYGDLNTNCRTGFFESPGYPGNYPNRWDGTYLLYIPGASRINFEFVGPGGFGIESRKDELYVGTGLFYDFNLIRAVNTFNTSTAVVIGDVTARLYDNRTANIPEDPPFPVYPPPFSLETDTAWLHFETDVNIQFNGFRLQWTSEVDDIPPFINGCPSDISVFVEAGTVPGMSVTWVPPMANDPSQPVSRVSTHEPGRFFLVDTPTLVTYTFRDRFGNTATCTFNVIVRQEDTTPPTVPNCPADISRAVQLGTPSLAVSWTPPTATDAGGPVTMTCSHQPGGQFPAGETTTVICTFTDPTGNMANCTFNVQVRSVDTEPPVIQNCPGNIIETIELGIGPATISWMLPTATDNSGTQRIVSNSRNPGDQFQIGSVQVEYIFSDDSGNQAVCEFVVTVRAVDTTPPLIDGCPRRLQEVIEVDQPGTVVRWIPPTAFDASMNVQVVPSHNPGQFFPGGQSTTVNYLFSDDQGNSARCSFCVEVIQVDTVPPDIQRCPPDQMVTIELGDTMGVAFWAVPTADDNSGTATLLSNSHDPGESFPIGETTVSYTYVDPADNIATCTFVVIVVPDDTVAPDIQNCPTAPVEVTVELGSTGSPVTWLEPTATDISGTAMRADRSHDPGSFFPIGSTSVIYRFTDASLNSATCSFVVRVNTVDTTPPTISDCPPFVQEEVELGAPGRSVVWVEPTATDRSPPVTVRSRSHAPGQTFTVGQTTVTYVFVDMFLNEAECSFTVLVTEVDTIAPTVSDCTDVVALVECTEFGRTVTWTEPTATDRSGIVQVVSRSHTPGDFFPTGVTTVTYEFVDGAGNRATCTFTVTVSPVDTTPPDVTGPGFIRETIELGSSGGPVFWIEPVPVDLCEGARLLRRSHAPGDFFVSSRPTTVTYEFSDETGNSVTYSFCVEFDFVDTTSPTIRDCPMDIEVMIELGQSGRAVSWTEPTATDLSGTARRQSRSNEPGSFFVVGGTLVVYSFVDDAGNFATCEFTVTVTPVDTQPPEIPNCPDNIGMTIELGRLGTSVSWMEPSATDISGVAVLDSRSHEPGNNFDVGSTTVTYRFRDDSNNFATCSFTITITTEDTIPPMVTRCPPPIFRTVELGVSGLVVTWVEPMATDISNTARLDSRSNEPGSFFGVGSTDVMYVFVDASSNVARCDFVIVVSTEDTTAPTINDCPTPGVVEVVELGTPGALVTWTPPTATDLSSPVAIDSTQMPGDFFLVGEEFVTYTFTDTFGNQAMCRFRVLVSTVDTTDPTIIRCPMLPVTDEVELGVTSAAVFYTEPTATDNSDDPNLLQTQTCRPGDQRPVGETLCIYIFTDPSGNTVTCRFPIVVTAVDTVPPTVNGCPTQDIDVVIELGLTEGRAVWPEPTAMDLAGATLESRDGAPGDLFPIGRTPVLYVFTDPSGNRATCQFTVNVRTEDTTAPDISNCPNDIERFIELGSPGLSITWLEPTATDLSGVATRATNTIPAFFSPGVVEIRYTFTDSSSNSAVCSFQVEVIEIDTTPPGIPNCPADITQSVELGTNSAAVQWQEPMANDISGIAQLVSRSHGPGEMFGVGSTTVTYLFRDNVGNTATCVFCVTIFTVDTTPPVCMNLPPQIARSVELGTGGLTVDFRDPTCLDVSLTGRVRARSHQSGDFFGVGDTTVRFTCADDSNNIAECLLVLRVSSVDTTAPDITGCPSDQDIEIELGTLRGFTFWVEPSATDVSGSVDVTRSHGPGDDFPIGVTTVTYMFTDPSRNEAVCTFRVIVTTVDTIPPEITDCPEMITQTVELGTPGISVTWREPSAMDASGVPMLVARTHMPGVFFPVGVSQVAYTFRDTSGNDAVCAFMILISAVDTTPPDCVDTPANIRATAELGVDAGAVVSWVEPTCDDRSMVGGVTEKTHEPGDFFLIGTTDVIYTCTDGSQNSRSCTFTVTVTAVDTTPPTVSCPPDITASTIAGAETVYVDYAGTVAKTDNSGRPFITSIQPDSGSAFPVGTTTVVIRVSDPSNNIASCTFNVIVFSVDPCDPQPCDNGGFCVVDSISASRCICPECFTGDSCQFPINACDSSNCQNGATCRPVPESCTLFTCDCPQCFRGDQCQNFQDACANSLCRNGAQCTPTDGCVAYTCRCPMCFGGTFCERRISICDLGPCANGAACIPGTGNECTSFSCACTGCFTGVRCDVEINPCFPNPCRNGATCTREAGACSAYSCQCVGCFSGQNCELGIPNPCSPNPCQRGGLCSPIPGSCNGYRCDCAGSFGGINCENAIQINREPCNSFPCEAGATCLPSGNGYVCICRGGYSGINCGQQSVPFPAACSPIRCRNGGTCRNSFDSSSNNLVYESQYTCVCAEGFTGTDCQTPTPVNPGANACLREACRNDETCLNVYNGFSQTEIYSCQCGVGFIGQNCEIPVQNPCDSNPCQNGAPCLPFNTYFRCACVNDFTGTFCQIPPDTGIPLITNCPMNDVVVTTTGPTAEATWSEPIPFGGDQTMLVYQSHNSGEPFLIGQTPVTYLYIDLNNQFRRCQFFVVVRETNRCLGLPCWNGGRCIETGPVTCDCSGTGFTGPTCDDAPIGGMTPCTPNPCMNFGTCVANGGTFMCLCRPGFQGNTCGIPIPDRCNPNPCLPGTTNNIVCTNGACSCPAGFTLQSFRGPCVGSSDPCDPNPCLPGTTNNIICTNGDCSCPDGYTLQSTTGPCTAPCDPSPCLFSAPCFEIPVNILARGFFCQCPPGRMGDTCGMLVGRKKRDVSVEFTLEREDVECPCQNGGVCASDSDELCLCPESYEGILCEVHKEVGGMESDATDGVEGNALFMPLVIGLLVLIGVLLVATMCVVIRRTMFREPHRKDNEMLITG